MAVPTWCSNRSLRVQASCNACSQPVHPQVVICPPTLTGPDYDYGYDPELALIGGVAVAALASVRW